MERSSLCRTDREFEEIYQRNVDMLYRLCYMYLKNAADAEDAVHTVFVKLMHVQKAFHDHDHEKAWLIRTTKNYCHDLLKNWWNIRRVDVDALPDIPQRNANELANDVRRAVLLLPEKYKIVLYLYYFEGYSVKEMAGILERKESTLQTQLSKGRELLKMDLGGNYCE